MNRTKSLTILVLVVTLILCSNILFAERMTLSTYYPAPMGAYDRIKLIPRDPLPLDPHCDDKEDIGVMYYDNGKDKETRSEGVYVCQKVNKDVMDWVFVSRPVEDDLFSQEDEKEEVTFQKAVCVKPDGKFGTCMSNLSFDGTCACQ